MKLKNHKRIVDPLISIFRQFILIGLAFIILYPVLYMISVSLRVPEDVLDPTVVWIPKTLTFENYKMAAFFLDYSKALMTTSLMALICTLFQCFTCSVTGYGFARFKFKGKTPLFFCALLTLLVPIQTIMMPLFTNFVKFTDMTGIPTIDTPLPMALSALFGVGLKSGLFIYIFHQFYKNMPVEIEDAAYIDGCGPIKTFFAIAAKNSASAYLVSFLLSFVWYWNDSYSSSLFYSSSRPLSAALANMSSVINVARKVGGEAYSIPETLAYIKTGALLCIIPVLLVYIILQRRFIKSVVTSGIVG